VIIIAGTVDIDPARVEEALEAAKPLMELTRAMPGCLDYVWSADPLVEGRLYVFERWEGREVLEAHFASAHFIDMRNTIAAHGLCGIDVSKVRVDLSEPVYDPQGQPRADFFTDSA
jgi:quinol monooxygenase YgiN